MFLQLTSIFININVTFLVHSKICSQNFKAKNAGRLLRLLPPQPGPRSYLSRWKNGPEKKREHTVKTKQFNCNVSVYMHKISGVFYCIFFPFTLWEIQKCLSTAGVNKSITVRQHKIISSLERRHFAVQLEYK